MLTILDKSRLEVPQIKYKMKTQCEKHCVSTALIKIPGTWSLEKGMLEVCE